MTPPARWRYELMAPHQPVCMGCWTGPATTAVWQGRAWQTSLCDACTAQHRRAHRQAQGELFGEEERET